MHDGMQYNPIQGQGQGQGQGHEPLKVGNSAILKGYLLPLYNDKNVSRENDHALIGVILASTTC